MEHTRGLVEDLALVFLVAAITTVICKKLKQPVVLGYLIAGMIVGPSVPIPLFADMDRIHALSELGVIFVMFAIGLEFSFRKMVRLASTSGIIALIQIALMVWLGYLVGQAFGWTSAESFYTGGMLAISSTMIIAKAFSEQGVRQKVKDLVIGVLIFEDLVAVLLIATLTAFSGAGEEASSVLPRTALQLIAFLAALVLIGFFIVPRSVRAIVKLNDPETLLVFGIGICMGFAFLAQKVGYSVALGSFLAGALVAESGKGMTLEHLLAPVRDLFAAIFFISIGMLVNPQLLIRYWFPIMVLTSIVIIGKIISVSVGSFLTGNDVRTSVQSGLSMAQIGEFSFIIASAGLALGAIREFLFPVAIAVSVITTFITPWLIGKSEKIASIADQKSPQRLQTFVTLYASWIERLRTRSYNPSKRRRLILIVLIDTLAIILIVMGTSIGMSPLTELFEKLTNVKPDYSKWFVITFACLVAAPFLIGMIRAARALGILLAEQALPAEQPGKVDLAEAPRTLMVITLEYGMVLILTIMILAVTQPFLPATATAILVLGIAIISGIIFWQRASNLQGHVRAGGEIILEALAKQSRSKSKVVVEDKVTEKLEELLPGLGTLHQVELNSSHASVGKSLAELNLHSLTGATVIAIIRQTVGVVVPGGAEVLHADDVLALIGTQDAVQSAKELLLKTHHEKNPSNSP
jgi:CPA2 family monovalent cation:H+ antiporter-2